MGDGDYWLDLARMRMGSQGRCSEIRRLMHCTMILVYIATTSSPLRVSVSWCESCSISTSTRTHFPSSLPPYNHHQTFLTDHPPPKP